MITVSIVQFAPVFCNLTANLKKFAPLFEHVKGSQLIVLPELANSGYNFTSRNQAFEASEELKNSRFINFLAAFSKSNHCCIVSGFNEREGTLLYNSAVLIDYGEIKGLYRKLHLFMNEKNFFEPGNLGLPVFNTSVGKIGMLVCFDWMFPEAWRALALQGAEIICHPSNLVLPYAQSAVPTHAINNRVFIATANRTGTESNLTFTGGSVIVDTRSKILAKGHVKKEEIISAKIEPSDARDKMITSLNDAFADRRPEVYLKYLLNK